MNSKKLEQIGLTEKEAKVYLACLELGATTIERISKKSGIKRTTIYDVIKSLKERALIGTTIRKKIKHYVASDPRELETKLEEKKDILRNIMPELLSITNLIDKKPIIRFYEGEEGIKEIYLDTLTYKDSPLWAWVTDEIFGTVGQNFIDYYLSQRIKNKIWAYVIAPDTEKLREYKMRDQSFLRQTKLQNSRNFFVEVEINLYGKNKIGIMAFKEGVGLIIESVKIYNTLKSIFDVQWEGV